MLEPFLAQAIGCVPLRPALLSVEPELDKTGEVAEALRAATAVDAATAGEPLDGWDPDVPFLRGDA